MDPGRTTAFGVGAELPHGPGTNVESIRLHAFRTGT
jgi:hypothetical protein